MSALAVEDWERRSVITKATPLFSDRMVAKHRSANAIVGTTTPIMQLISQVELDWKSSGKINQ
jgi:hypothetical protein